MDAGWKTGNSSLILSLSRLHRCLNQIEAGDLSHVICTQGVNSIINSRCRYYNSGYNGLAGRPCSAQLKLGSSDVDAECRNVGIPSCDISCSAVRHGQDAIVALSSPRRVVFPVKS